MAISNLPIAGRTRTGDDSSGPNVVSIGAPIVVLSDPTIGYGYDDVQTLNYPNTQIAAAGLVIGSPLHILTVPSQFEARGYVVRVDDPGTGANSLVSARINRVLTPKNASIPTNLSLDVVGVGSRTTVTTATVTATGSGFVQAVYIADRPATNAEKADLTISFGSAGLQTTKPVIEGVIAPVAAIISNTGEESFNIVING